ncbi:MAG: preprotein translocase subunit SecE [Blastomonas sp.]|jgi:preprotein translocase subunit SecE
MATQGKKTSPGEFVNQVKTEASKVVWPSRQETITTAIMVFIMMTILAIFFLAVDSVFGAVVKWLLTLA